MKNDSGTPLLTPFLSAKLTSLGCLLVEKPQLIDIRFLWHMLGTISWIPSCWLYLCPWAIYRKPTLSRPHSIAQTSCCPSSSWCGEQRRRGGRGGEIGVQSTHILHSVEAHIPLGNSAECYALSDKVLYIIQWTKVSHGARNTMYRSLLPAAYCPEGNIVAIGSPCPPKAVSAGTENAHKQAHLQGFQTRRQGLLLTNALSHNSKE